MSAPSPFVAGFLCRCPRCGKGAMFDGFLTPAPRCTACGLDYSFIDSGDGPAVFGMLIAGFIVVAAALYVELNWQPPYWLHAALWLPIGLIVTLGILRPLKGWLIAYQYALQAAEGRIQPPAEGRLQPPDKQP